MPVKNSIHETISRRDFICTFLPPAAPMTATLTLLEEEVEKERATGWASLGISFKLHKVVEWNIPGEHIE